MKNSSRFFDSQSFWYDTTRMHFHWFAKKWINAVEIKPEQVIVSIGCGTGSNFGLFNERLRNTGQIIGVDFSPKMLDIARKKSKNSGIKNVTLLCPDANTYNFPHEIDVVVFAFSLYAIPNYEIVIKNAFKSLKEGGQIIIVDYKKSNHPFLKKLNPLWVKFSKLFHGSFSKEPWVVLEEISENLVFSEHSCGFKFFAKSIK